MKDYHLPLQPLGSYHLVSRAHGDEKIFKEAWNYSMFLERLVKYVLPIATVNAYCLLPNHFHLLVTIRSIDLLEKHFQEKKEGRSFHDYPLSDFIMERFSNMLNSYCKSFNYRYHRKGGLFMDYLRRVPIESLTQLQRTVYYIHNNPVCHGYCETIGEWRYSSWPIFFFNKACDWIDTTPVLNCFGGIGPLLQYHRQKEDDLEEEEMIGKLPMLSM